jgi:hypothetical protein
MHRAMPDINVSDDDDDDDDISDVSEIDSSSVLRSLDYVLFGTTSHDECWVLYCISSVCITSLCDTTKRICNAM